MGKRQLARVIGNPGTRANRFLSVNAVQPGKFPLDKEQEQSLFLCSARKIEKLLGSTAATGDGRYTITNSALAAC